MQTSQTLNHVPEEILSELHALVAEAEGMASNALDASDDAVASLRERYDAAQDRLSKMYGRAKRKVVDSAAYAEGAIRENPYKTLAIVAGVGLLIGAFVAIRRNNR